MGVPKLRRRNAKCETPKMRNSDAKRPIFNLIHLKLSISTEEKQIDLKRHLLLVSHFPLNKNNSK